VLKQKLTADLEQIDILSSSPFSHSSSMLSTNNELSVIADSIKTFRPFFIGEFLEDLMKEKQTTALSQEELEARGNALSDKLFLNSFPNQKEIIGDVIYFAEDFTNFIYKFNYCDRNTHHVLLDENKIYNLKKFEFVRNIFESLNFELLTNAEFLRLLPCVTVLQRIFSFSALCTNSFNCAVTRLIALQSFFLSDLTNKDQKTLLSQKNQKFLKDYVRFTFLTCGNISSFSNGDTNPIFSSFEDLLGKLVYLKDFIVLSAELNELVFLLTQNILHFTYALGEMDKSESKKISKAKVKNLLNLFKEFFCCYSNYLSAAAFKQGNSVKSLDVSLLGKFTNALILLKKAEKEYPQTHLLIEDKDYTATLKEFVEVFLFRNVFAKQSILASFISKSDGLNCLIELDYLFEVKNFDQKISLKQLKDYCVERVIVRENALSEFLQNAVVKYHPSNINKV